MVTDMQRLSAAVKGEISDRIPIFCNLFEQGPREMGMSPQEYYLRGECVAEAQLRLKAKYGYDNVWCLFFAGKAAEILGCKKFIYPEYGPPNVADYIIKDYHDIMNLKIPDDIVSHPAFAEERKCINLLKKELAGNSPICAYISSSMTMPALLVGMDKWMELLLSGPADIRDEMLNKCHEFFIKEIQAYRSLGVTTLVYSNPFGSTDTISRKFFMQYSLPWIEKDIRAVGAQGIVYYCGMSRLNAVIETVLERTGIDTYYLSPLDDIKESKSIVGNSALTCGVINEIQLSNWTIEDIQREVKRIIDAGMAGRSDHTVGAKFIFGAGLPAEVPDDHIKMLVDAAIEHGSY